MLTYSHLGLYSAAPNRQAGPPLTRVGFSFLIETFLWLLVYNTSSLTLVESFPPYYGFSRPPPQRATGVYRPTPI